MTYLDPRDFIPEVRCAICERDLDPATDEWTAEFVDRDDIEVRPVCTHCRTCGWCQEMSRYAKENL